VLTIRRMAAGSGYKYLMSSVARGDGASDLSSPLTRYYAESGTPPGRWVGGGVAGLGLEAGGEVSDEHLRRMLVEMVDPVTGEPLGRQAVGQPLSLAERVERRLARLDRVARDDKRDEIEAEERQKAAKQGAAVAGFDLTFSPTKSVSAAWALADEGTKAVIYDCHLRAVERTLRYAERTFVHSRSGKNGVVQEDIEGVVGAAYTHYDTRAGDPQLHDHVVVWNRARSVSDGGWRSLDSRGLFRSVVTMSEIYDGVLSDLLTVELGVGWEAGASRNGMRKHEITGVPEALIREFSQRRRQIDAAEDALVAEFEAAQGRLPSPVEKRHLAQQANLQTRADKQHRSLAEMSAEWRQRAAGHVGARPEAWVTSLRDRNDLPLLRADDLSDDMLAEAAALAVEWQGERRATFSRANLMAEVARQLAGVRFASPDDRIAVIDRATDMTVGGAVQVTPPELLYTPGRYRRPDGSSRLRPADQHRYTTSALLDAEQRLLDLSRRTDGPTVTVGTLAAIAEADLSGRDYPLSTDQAVAVEKIATSRRPLDVLVGPAGTGKTTTMAGLRAAWEAEHGPGSVIGLAPSASAADVLGVELGIDTDNTAKWLHEHHHQTARLAELGDLQRRIAAHPYGAPPRSSLRERAAKLREQIDRWQFRAGQLVIVDEASLAGTFALDELADAASRAGAKLVLVGDPHQLSAVDAGGMFRSLVRDRDDLPAELTDVRRFRHHWERTASLELRLGHQAALDAYETHGRIVSGRKDDMIDQLYTDWRADREDGKRAVMIAQDAATVADLNRRARADRVAAGAVSENGLTVAGGQTAGTGDVVVTRQNNRRLATGRSGFVKNRDLWTVTACNHDGSMVVQRVNGGGSVVLPAPYVAEHVELAYATTAHGAQGMTVDTSHGLVTPLTTREALYVAATRGRDSNHMYVVTDYDPDPDTAHEGMTPPQTARQVLAGALANEGAERSATDTIRTAWDATESIPSVAAEYQTIARQAQAERWDALIARSGLTAEQVEQVRASEAYGPLVHAFAYAEARGLDPEAVFPELVAARSLADAGDIASLLHARTDRWIERAGSRHQAATDLIAGLIPPAHGVTDPDLARALTERQEALERRAMALAEQAVERRPPWVRHLGTEPKPPAARATWLREVRIVAAYRERWGLNGLRPLDSPEPAGTIEQIGHQKRAQAAAERALAISRHARQDATEQADVGLEHAAEQKGVQL